MLPSIKPLRLPCLPFRRTVQTVEKQFEYAVADPGTPLEDVVALLQE